MAEKIEKTEAPKIIDLYETLLEDWVFAKTAVIHQETRGPAATEQSLRKLRDERDRRKNAFLTAAKALV